MHTSGHSCKGFFLIRLFEWGRLTLNVAAKIKGFRRRKLYSLPICLHSRWQVHLSCGCCILLSILEPPSLKFHCRLKTNRSSWKLTGLEHQIGTAEPWRIMDLVAMGFSTSHVRLPLLDYPDSVLKTHQIDSIRSVLLGTPEAETGLQRQKQVPDSQHTFQFVFLVNIC